MSIRTAPLDFVPRINFVQINTPRTSPNVAPPARSIDNVPRQSMRKGRGFVAEAASKRGPKTGSVAARAMASRAEEKARQAMQERLNSGRVNEAQRLVGMLRCERRMSSRAIALAIGCSESCVRDWSLAYSLPSANNMAKLRIFAREQSLAATP